MKPPNEPYSEWCCPHDGGHSRRFLPVPETPEEEEIIHAYSELIYFSVADLEQAKVRWPVTSLRHEKP